MKPLAIDRPYMGGHFNWVICDGHCAPTTRLRMRCSSRFLSVREVKIEGILWDIVRRCAQIAMHSCALFDH